MDYFKRRIRKNSLSRRNTIVTCKAYTIGKYYNEEKKDQYSHPKNESVGKNYPRTSEKIAQEKARIVIEAVIKTGELLIESGKSQQKPIRTEGRSGTTLGGSESTLPENIDKDLAYRYRIIYRNRDKVRETIDKIIN
ncbi:hypothetical protein LCGC14_2507420 [marine sediment metagenome]|uniref:Uncharacterized protein n=1 Tax=marine sediment metagenome TaxID=412755 RepID=A0A0F9DBZ7_9ZZZZ